MKTPSKAKTRTAMRKAAELLRFEYDGRPREDIEKWVARLDVTYVALAREKELLRRMQERILMAARGAGVYIAEGMEEKSHEQK